MTLDPCQPPTPLELAHTEPWVPWLLGSLITGGIVALVFLGAWAVVQWFELRRRRRRRVPGPQRRHSRPNPPPPA